MSGGGLQHLAHTVGNSCAIELVLMECMWSVPCQVRAAIGEPVNLGTTTSGGGSQHLTWAMGNSHAIELVLTGCMWSATHQVQAARCELVNIGTNGTIMNTGGQMVTTPPYTPWLMPAIPNGRLHISTRLYGYWPGCPLATTVTACDEQLRLWLTSQHCVFLPHFSRQPSSGLAIAPSICSCRPAAARRRVSHTATTCTCTVIGHQPDAMYGSPTSASHNEKASIIQNGKPKTSLDDTEREKDKDKLVGKKVQKMLKNQVHKEQHHISMIGWKIGHGMGKPCGGLTLQRTMLTPREYFLSLLLIWGMVLTLPQPTCTRHWELTRCRTKCLPFILVGTALTL